MFNRRMLVLFALIGGTLLVADWAAACTGIQVRPKDGAAIIGRTMEFGSEMESDVVIVPRGKVYTGTAPGNKPGLTWTTKYGAVGMNGLKMPQILDGVNEKGLGVGLFYFPGFAQYQKVSQASVREAVAPWELGTYLLTTCADVDEAIRAVQTVVVGPTVLEAWGFTPGTHYRVHDAAGKAVVLEYVDGQLKVHANPVGVITNAPTFDWHMLNLRNYVKLSPASAPPLEIDHVKLAPFGAGSGMLGLPGDFTPPSRFVRAVALSQSVKQAPSAEDGVKQAFHILNNFDIPKGTVREADAGKMPADYTQWTSVSDLTNRKFYFRTYDNGNVRVIDLKKCDFGAKNVTFLSIAGEEQFIDFLKKSN